MQPLDDGGPLEQIVRRERVFDLERASHVEPFAHLAVIGRSKDAAEHGADRVPDDLAGDVVGPPQLTLVLELELARDRRQGRVDIAHAWDDRRLVRSEPAAFGVRDDVFEQRDRQALADAGPLVHARILPRLKRHFLDDLPHEVGDLHLGRGAVTPG